MVFVSLKGVVTKLAGGQLPPFIFGEAVMTGETTELVLPVLFALLHKSLIRSVALIWKSFSTSF